MPLCWMSKWARARSWKRLDDARKLSDLMIQIGDLAGRKTICLLSDMN